MHRFLLAAVAALALSASPAHAQQRGAAAGDGRSLSVYGIASYFWWNTGVGVGARYQFPLIPQGILHAGQIRDDIAMDAGLDFIHVGWGDVRNYNVTTDTYYWTNLSYNALIPAVGFLWNFHITPELTVYPKLDAGFAFGWWSDDIYGGTPHASSFFIQGVAGATLKLQRLSLRGELGSGMFKLGVSIPL